MRAGKLRRRIALERKQVIQDAYGAEIVTWWEFASPRAAVEAIGGREYFAAQQVEQGEATVRIRLRFRDDVQVADRARWGQRVYDIEAVLDDARQRETTLMCREMRE